MPLDDQFRVRCDAEWKDAVEGVASQMGKKFAYFVRESVTLQARAWYRRRRLPVPPALYDPHINGEGDSPQLSERLLGESDPSASD